MNDWLSTGGVLGGLIALGQLGWGIYKDRKGGALRKGQAEAAKVSLDVVQAEQSLPHVQESLRLGNVADAVAVQQQVINGLRDHAAWQDQQLQARDGRIGELERRLAERDRKIEELEQRLGVAEDALSTAKRLIGELRATSRQERGSK